MNDYERTSFGQLLSFCTKKTTDIVAVASEPIADEERDREMAMALQKQLYYQEAKQQVSSSCSSCF